MHSDATQFLGFWWREGCYHRVSVFWFSLVERNKETGKEWIGKMRNKKMWRKNWTLFAELGCQTFLAPGKREKRGKKILRCSY